MEGTGLGKQCVDGLILSEKRCGSSDVDRREWEQVPLCESREGANGVLNRPSLRHSYLFLSAIGMCNPALQKVTRAL